jgi:di-N-acetylchitobiase
MSLAGLAVLVSVFFHAALCDRHEVYAFSTNQNEGLSEIVKHATTVAFFGSLTTEAVALCHSHGVRAVAPTPDISPDSLLNATAVSVWLDACMALVDRFGLDGLNVDFEHPLDAPSTQAPALTSLVSKLQHRLASRNLIVAVDVAWSPQGIDGRMYDYAGLAKAADLLFIMSYDLRSQVFGQSVCLAGPNSDIRLVELGVRQYLQIAEARKLVLGLPWYGYQYSCENAPNPYGVCQIASVPFRGCNCSDAAGRQKDYRILEAMTGLAVRSSTLSAVRKDVLAGGTNWTQLWYDDPETLREKRALVQKFGLGGWGMWNAQSIDYSNATQVREFWS